MRPLVFHPPLIAAFMVLSVYSANAALIPLHHLWRPLGVAVAGSLVVWAIWALLLRSLERGAAAASVSVVGFFGFAWFENATGFEAETLLIAWVLVVVGLAVAAGLRWRWGWVANAFAVFLVVVAAGQIAAGRMAIAIAQRQIGEELPTELGNARRPPDIFYLVLDGYGRGDVLKEKLGYDNGPFLDALRQRGFRVLDQAVSNYVQTELSIGATLNLSFMQDLFPNFGPADESRLPLAPLIDDSEVLRTTRKLGYLSVAVKTGFPSLGFRGSDLSLERAQSYRLIEDALIRMTPLGLTPFSATSMYDQRRDMLLGAFANLDRLARPAAKPRLIIAHILAPHPPFVFDADGNPTKSRGPYGYWDGSDYMEQYGTPESYREGYRGQIEYLNKLLLKSIDRLLTFTQNGQPPVIILQGDHGSKLGLHQNSLERTDAAEAFAVLTAVRAPESVQSRLYDRMSNVNTFRVLFNGLFGSKMLLLPDRSWYSPYPRPFDFTEVTHFLR